MYAEMFAMHNNGKKTTVKRLKTIIKMIANKDPQFRFEVLRMIGKVLVPNYRFKWPQLEWWRDPTFNEYLVKFNELHKLNTDRRWMLYQLMRLVRNVPGDTAECGVYMGAGSYIICKLNQENEVFQRTHYLFDSFEGLSTPLECDGKYWTKGDLSCDIDSVRKNLAEFRHISIHKGWIPQHFSEIEHHDFCFVHIDVDLFRPTFDSLEFFYPRMNDGGLIVCDDYGLTTCPGATKAVDQFLHNKIENMISLSGGGGFIIKGVEVSKPLNI